MATMDMEVFLVNTTIAFQKCFYYCLQNDWLEIDRPVLWALVSITEEYETQ